MRQAAAQAKIHHPPEAVFTLSQVEAAFRHGYGVGADGAQDERRGRPFTLETEAWETWLKRL